MSDFFHGDIAESVEGEEEVETSPSTATSTGRSSQRHSGRTSRSMDRESSKQDIYDYGDESEIVGATIVDISPSLQGPLRKGKWTTEEEQYANKIIYYFNKGMLGIACGTTLRSYLSEKLNCDPMRITKKFAGASCIGKQVYQACEDSMISKSSTAKTEEELKVLQQQFLKRLFNKSGGGSATSLESLEDMMDGDGSVGGSSDLSKSNLRSGMQSKPKQIKIRMIEKQQKPTRTISAPDLAHLNMIHPKSSSYTSLMKRQRSISLMDLEHYAVDDDAAGDLLMQFMVKINETSVKKIKTELQIDNMKEEVIFVSGERSRLDFEDTDESRCSS